MFEEEFKQATSSLKNRKNPGVDEEVVEIYKMIFNIKKPENPETWTALERKYQQTLAVLDVNRKYMVSQILKDVNQYLSIIAQNDWRDEPKIYDLMMQHSLADFHTRLHIGDIVGVPKNNGKDECTMEAWRPIMCLNTIRKIITKILSNRIYKIIKTHDYNMLTAWQFGFQKHIGVPEALYTAKLTIQSLLMLARSLYKYLLM